MATAAAMRREIIVDERGHALRATWHGESRRVVLSHWLDDECVSTLHLEPVDAARLTAFLACALGDAASRPAEASATDQ
jgi:hypothetical protein